MDYNFWKTKILNQFITEVQGITNPNGIQCVTVDWSWADFLFPNISIRDSITTGDARTLFAAASPSLFTKVKNSGVHPDTDPAQGDIAVYGPTPALGYTNTYPNPDGHTGIVDSWDANGVYLVQQDGSHQELPTQIKYRPYSYAPLIGLLRPKIRKEDMTDQEIDDTISLAFNQVVGKPPTDVDFNAYRPLIKNNNGEGIIQMFKNFDTQKIIKWRDDPDGFTPYPNQVYIKD